MRVLLGTNESMTFDKFYYGKFSITGLKGKGNKKRLVPIRNEVMNILIEYMTINRMTEPYCCTYPLFSNSRREHFTRMGINNILQKYVIQAKLDRPELFPEKVTPHILRHSKAMHLLQAGVNIVYIRDFLGHSSITTTEVYARADSKLKREALEKVHNLIPESKAEPALWLNDAGIMNWLKQMR
jgi:phage-related integrase